MLDGIEALLALERCGTISEAALSLRLTQSAVTKRIQALQTEVGFRLTEPDGRRVRLTPEARRYADRARPLLVELAGLAEERPKAGATVFSVALAESVAASWGPAALREVMRREPRLQLQLHAHRSALVIEAVRLGRYHLGICTSSVRAHDLVSHPILVEPFVFLHGGLRKQVDESLPIITIETGSATWPAIASSVHGHSLLANRELIRVESFSAAYQMVVTGFGNGLLPLGLVKTMGVASDLYRLLPGVRREISLFVRKTLGQQEACQLFLRAVKEQAALVRARKVNRE